MAKLGGMGGGDPKAKRPKDESHLPRGLRQGLTWDIAQTAVFLASPAGFATIDPMSDPADF